MNKHVLSVCVLLAFLFAGVLPVSAQKKLKIRYVYPETSKVTIEKKALGPGDIFREDAVIDWLPGQEMAVFDVADNTPYYYTQRAFAEKGAETVLQFRRFNQLSTRGGWTVRKGARDSARFPEKRIALVIGNANYDSYLLHSLKSPLAEAAAVTDKLLSLGFDVMTGYDCKHDEMDDIVKRFYEEANNYEVALFYFAGHGLKYETSDYILPSDINPDGSYCLKDAVSMEYVITRAADSKAQSHLIFVDACRNPVSWNRAFTIEKNQIEAPNDFCIFQSTGSGRTADDRISADDRFGPCAKAFLKEVGVPGRPLTSTLDEIRISVVNQTAGKQNPVFTNRLIRDAGFMFCRVASAAKATTTPAPQTTTARSNNATAQTTTANASVAKTENKTVTPAKTVASGRVTIHTTPISATIKVDGIPVKSGVSFTISPGSHAVVTSCDGYVTNKQTITVQAGEDKSYTISLSSKSGWDIFVENVAASWECAQLGAEYAFLSPHFPVGAGLSGGIGPFELTARIAAPAFSERVVYHEQHDGSIYFPKVQWSIMPTFQYKYFGFGVALGAVCADKKPIISSVFPFKDQDGKQFDIDNKANVVYCPEIDKSNYFALTPTVKGYIPVPDFSMDICLGAGYSICPAMPERGGFSFSIGVRFNSAYE